MPVQGGVATSGTPATSFIAPATTTPAPQSSRLIQEEASLAEGKRPSDAEVPRPSSAARGATRRGRLPRRAAGLEVEKARADTQPAPAPDPEPDPEPEHAPPQAPNPAPSVATVAQTHALQSPGRRPANPSLAQISVTAVTTTSAIPGSNIRTAIARIPIADCYRNALRSRGVAATGTAILRMKIDVTGYVTAAILEGAEFLPDMRGCIEKAARSARVKDVDTGDATAAVTIRFTSP